MAKLLKFSDLSPASLNQKKMLGPTQKKLDLAARGITVLTYKSARKPAMFQCDKCDNIWTVKQARYVTQQKRGCALCGNITRSKVMKKAYADKK